MLDEWLELGGPHLEGESGCSGLWELDDLLAGVG